MNLSIGLGLLLWAGITLPSAGPDDDDLPPPTPPGRMETPQPPSARGEGPRSRPAGGPLDRQSPLYRYGTPSDQRGDQWRQPSRERDVPLPPTDPDLRSPDSPLAAPTEGGEGNLPRYGTPSTRPAYPPGMRPNSLYRGPSSASRSRYAGGSRYGAQPIQRQTRNDLFLLEQQAQQLQPRAGVTQAAPQISKPFSGYTPGPAVSPYMELYRRDTGGLDPYNTFVRPQLEQRRANQIIGGEIRGLQSNQRLQSTVIQRLGKNNDRVQTGTMAPEYFQNYGSFYPSFSR